MGASTQGLSRADLCRPRSGGRLRGRRAAEAACRRTEAAGNAAAGAACRKRKLSAGVATSCSKMSTTSRTGKTEKLSTIFARKFEADPAVN